MKRFLAVFDAWPMVLMAFIGWIIITHRLWTVLWSIDKSLAIAGSWAALWIAFELFGKLLDALESKFGNTVGSRRS